MMFVLRTLFLLLITMPLTAGDVKTGIDNLLDTKGAMLQGKSVAVVTHAAARTTRGVSTAKALIGLPGVHVKRFLTPEHGYYGTVQAGIAVDDDSIEGRPAISLYGARRRPSEELVNDVDAVIIDLQDIGVRSYTYVSTMIEVMETCARTGTAVIILDRPNPWGGTIVDGAIIDDSLRSFIGRIPIPYVHGMTLGEIATMTNGEGWLEPDAEGRPRRCSLTVIKVKRWNRTMTWEQTGLSWYATSPNIPTLTALRCYAITGLSGELGLANIGVGSTQPFSVVGGPAWAGDSVLVHRMARYGVVLRDARYSVPAGRWAHQMLSGYSLAMTDTVAPFRAGIELARTLLHRHPTLAADTSTRTKGKAMFTKAVGSAQLVAAVFADSSEQVTSLAVLGVAEFRRRRERYLLYP
jgi:uncharacterized protein YbbC (DUF1343 family)